MNPPRLLDPSDLDAAFGAGRYLLFKHSLLCPVSAQAFREYMHFLAARGGGALPDDLPTGWISVTDQRPLSNAIAERTSVRHESPQAFVLEDGAVRWHASHGSITAGALEAAWSGG